MLFATPEYNRSVPGVLKNAIDVGSRPYGSSVWQGKPGAVMSVSPGAFGGFGANHHLRQSLVFLDVPAMQQPEAYIAGASKLFDDAGTLTNPSTRELLEKFGAAWDGGSSATWPPETSLDHPASYRWPGCRPTPPRTFSTMCGWRNFPAGRKAPPPCGGRRNVLCNGE